MAYYDDAYAAFNASDYKKAKEQAENARVKFGAENPLQARFDLLAAMATGKLDGEQAYKNALNQVITRHPDTDEQRTAREILRILGGASARLPGRNTKTTASGESNFKMNENQVHFIIVAFDPGVNLNAAKIALSDFNKKYNRSQRLSISNVFLGTNSDNRIPMLIVRRFKNSSEAMSYYDGAVKNAQDFVKEEVNYDVFAISLNNYREILRSKVVEPYKSFFEENYLEN